LIQRADETLTAAFRRSTRESTKRSATPRHPVVAGTQRHPDVNCRSLQPACQLLANGR
jgi:hypothetical protein